jgi:hypothetical protein
VKDGEIAVCSYSEEVSDAVLNADLEPAVA